MDSAATAADNSPKSEDFGREIVRDAVEAKKVRGLVDSRRAKLRARERVRSEAEDKAIEEDLKRVSPIEVEAVRASAELATIARDLGAQWSIFAFS